MAGSDPHVPASKLASACFFLFLAAFFCGLAQVSLHLDTPGFGSGFEISNVARHLAATGEFGDPFSLPTVSTADVAALYTAVVALVFHIFGFSYAAALVLILLSAVILSIGPMLLPVLSQRVFGHLEPGIAGGILIIVSGRPTPQ